MQQVNKKEESSLPKKFIIKTFLALLPFAVCAFPSSSHAGIPTDYVLHLGLDENDQDIFPGKTAVAPYFSTGAASALMVLEYLDSYLIEQVPPTQSDIYDLYYSGSADQEMSPADMQHAMIGQAPFGYHFQAFNDSNKDLAVKRIVHWIDYRVPGVSVRNVPALVPTCGDYGEPVPTCGVYDWKVIRGFATDVDPMDQNDVSYIPDVTVLGIWLADPKEDELGFNVFMGGQAFKESFLPVNGKYPSVLEPPEGYDENQEAALAEAGITYNKGPENLELVGHLADSSSTDDGTATASRSAGSAGFDWSTVIPNALWTADDFRLIFDPLTETKNIAVTAEKPYSLIVFTLPDSDEAAVLLRIGENGEFIAATWTDDRPATYPLISGSLAANAAWSEIERKYGITNPPLVNSSFVMKGKLNPFFPKYKFDFSSWSWECTAYVAQDGAAEATCTRKEHFKKFRVY